MRIDCGECGAEDKVWATRNAHNGAIAETLEHGTNAVHCRKCKAHGWVDLDPHCRNCSSTNVWRWPVRDMNSNQRRWLCRDCGVVTDV
jgi:transposase-like protein